METKGKSILNRIFTRDSLSQLIDGKTNSAYTSVIRRYIMDASKKKNKELISELYCELKKNYRNEYYYKNTLLNRFLLGIHSTNTTTALTEVAIGASKADLVLINGKAVVYEIKTELDNLDRLNAQIADYYKAFDHVAVVTYEKNLEQLYRILNYTDKPVGIYVLRTNNKIGTVKKPQKYTTDLNKDVLFKILRKREYESILIQKYGVLPNTTQFRYYGVCRNMFLQIPIEESYRFVIEQLKSRIKIEKDKIEKIPYELRFLAYFMDLKNDDYQKLEMFLERSYGGV